MAAGDQSTISNTNTITRPDNMAMIRFLDVTLIHLTKVGIRHYNKLIIIYSQPDHNDAFSDFEYTATIDHHEDLLTWIISKFENNSRHEKRTKKK